MNWLAFSACISIMLAFAGIFTICTVPGTKYENQRRSVIIGVGLLIVGCLMGAVCIGIYN